MSHGISGRSDIIRDNKYYRKGNIVQIGETDLGELRLIDQNSDDGNTGKFISLKAPQLTGDVELTLPVADGTANQVLKTNGSGALSWTDMGGGSTLLSTNPGGLEVHDNVGIDGSTDNGASIVKIKTKQSTETNAAIRWNFTAGGHLLPEDTEDYDIGSAEKKVRHLFLSDNSIRFKDTSDIEHSLGIDSTGKIVYGVPPVGGSDDRKPLQIAGEQWTTNNDHIYSSNSGNVGIGTTTPTYPLEIHGKKTNANVGDNTIKWIELKTWSHIQSALLISGLGSNPTAAHPRSNMSVWAEYGYVTNSGYLQASDDRIKSFEIPIPVGLKEILQLEPKFYLKHPSVFVDADDETGSTLSVDEEGIFFEMIDGVKEPLRCEPEYGLISQAVEKIEGLEILVTDEINGIKNVNYIGLIPVLIKALQEQQIIIDTEKTKVATLEAKTATLETTVSSQQTTINDLVARIAALENA